MKKNIRTEKNVTAEEKDILNEQEETEEESDCASKIFENSVLRGPSGLLKRICRDYTRFGI